jgi:hypothetical protein
MAYTNPKIGMYPIGYPMFLRLFSVFSTSGLVLVTFQYLLLQLSLLYLFVTIVRFFNILSFTRFFLFVILLINPVTWYLANLVSSDALFLALSIFWFSQLIWLIHYYSWKLILLNAILLFILFTIRYNALYYPIIACASIFLNRHSVLKRLLGVGFGLILIALFIRYTSNDYLRLSGKSQFSPFSGWQLANNAMYAYRYVDSAHIKPLPSKFAVIDKMVRNYFDSTRDVHKYPSEQLVASTVYMWTPTSPLNIYADSLIKHDPAIGPIKRFATAAPMMKAYGIELIKTYPDIFIKHYIIPNCRKYYTPPIEFLGYYNDKKDTIQEVAVVWFNFKNNRVSTKFKIKDDVKILAYYPYLVGILNVLVVLNVLTFFILKFYKYRPDLLKFLMLTFSLWLVNFLFSVFASPIALRFQLFPIFISLSLAVLLMECLIRISFSKEPGIIETNSHAIAQMS